MKEKWTGELIGRMHNEDVTFDELGAEAGWGKSYISMILNGLRSPAGAKEKLESALDAIIEQRAKNGRTGQ